MAGRCDFSDLPVDQCGHCRAGTKTMPEEVQSSRDQFALGPWITAQYPGRCSENARHPVRPGDQIRSDGQGGWLCADCG